jgi:UDP-GlcNAc:undecaprenyl-phosphate GlcNAc-1-phosphate transferase
VDHGPLQAALAFAVAAVVTGLITPVTVRLAWRIGAVDEPRERGLSNRAMPRLGGLAILAGALAAAAIWLPETMRWRSILAAAVIITVVGCLDDLFDLPPGLKLAGQFAAALVAVLGGVEVRDFTLPLLGRTELGSFGAPATLLGLVLVMNVVNLSDGVDGLAAGVSVIAGIAFAIIAFDLGRDNAALLAAITAGAAAGFLTHNFHPASVIMGDSGSNLLGLLLGCAIVEGTLKTNALIALLVPLVVLAVPFLDTGFVVAKRLKYKRAIYRADSNHFHHRFHRLGFSQRRTVLYLYAWTATMAALAVALRFVPYSDNSGKLDPTWSAVMACLGLAGLAASVYLVWVLEILKLRRLRAWQMRRADPGTEEHEIDERVERDLETGEFSALR